MYVLNDIVGTLLKIYFQIKIRKIHPKDILDLFFQISLLSNYMKIINESKESLNTIEFHQRDYLKNGILLTSSFPI